MPYSKEKCFSKSAWSCNQCCFYACCFQKFPDQSCFIYIIVSIFPDFSEIRNADRYILFHRSATPFLDIFRTFFRSIYKKYHTMNQICIQARTKNVLLTCISRQKKRYPHLRISLFQPLTAVSFIFIEISSTILHAVAPEPMHGSARYHHTEPTVHTLHHCFCRFADCFIFYLCAASR